MTQAEFNILNRALSVAYALLRAYCPKDHPDFSRWMNENEQATQLLVAMNVRRILAETNARISSDYAAPRVCSCGQVGCSCQHEPSEDCMICSSCGHCDETCDEASDMCDTCRAKLCDLLDEAKKRSQQ